MFDLRQLLDKILQAGNFDPGEEVYITNSVFRLPPRDDDWAFRKPNDQEVEYYRPFVSEIIRLINPYIILLTGNATCQSILKGPVLQVYSGNGHRNRTIGSCRSFILHIC